MAQPVTDLGSLYTDHLADLQVRFSSALEAAGHDAALIYSGLLLPAFRDDQSYPFRAQAWFSIWAPLSPAPDCFVYVKPGSRPKLLICAPEDFWYEPACIPTGEWTRHFEVLTVANLAAARAALPQDLSRVALIGEPAAEFSHWGLAGLNPEKLLLALDFTRAVKTPYERSMLRLANRLGARGHRAAADAFAAGMSEFGIHQAFLAAMGRREQELPYNAIVALNEAGSVLHYQNLKREPPAAHHSLLIDAGAQWAGYASDITRTYAAGSGSQSARDFAALIEAMDAAQQSRVRKCAPGCSGRISIWRPTGSWRRCCAMPGSSIAMRTRRSPAGSRAYSCHMAWAICWDCRCTMWGAGSARPRAGRLPGPRATLTCA